MRDTGYKYVAENYSDSLAFDVKLLSISDISTLAKLEKLVIQRQLNVTNLEHSFFYDTLKSAIKRRIRAIYLANQE